MGDYHAYVENLPPPLRPLETAPARVHTFGNPFKVNKNFQMIDEADEAMPGQQKALKRKEISNESMISNSKKRKRGPIPKHFTIKKPYVPLNGYSTDSDYLSSSSTSDIEMSDLENTIPRMNGNVLNGHVPSTDVVPRRRLSRSESISDNSREDEENCEIKNLREIDDFNTILKIDMFRDVRRPGNDYSPLFKKLEKIRGDTDLRCLIIEAVIHEAARFRRWRMIQLLRQYYTALRDQKRRYEGDLEIVDIEPPKNVV